MDERAGLRPKPRILEDNVGVAAVMEAILMDLYEIEVANAITAGASHYLAKSMLADELLAAITNALHS
jgi:DNA-binding NarL/FixJ family response regulator